MNDNVESSHEVASSLSSTGQARRGAAVGRVEVASGSGGQVHRCGDVFANRLCAGSKGTWHKAYRFLGEVGEMCVWGT